MVLTLIDSGGCYSAGGQGENQICVGFRHQFDLINERTGDASPFYKVDGKWAHLVSAIDVYEDEEPELLLCFNSTPLIPLRNSINLKSSLSSQTRATSKS